MKIAATVIVALCLACGGKKGGEEEAEDHKLVIL